MNAVVASSFALLISFGALFTETGSTHARSADHEWTKEERLLTSNAIGYATIGAWGLTAWRYGERPPHFTSEGWFEADTLHGGADKIGHTYATYGVSHFFAYYLMKWGYDRDHAALYSAISSFGWHAFMEYGDSFSSFGFSIQDLTMNTVGVIAGYVAYRYPQINRYVDLRVEYIPTLHTYDIFTDYEGIKYLAAFKLDPFIESSTSLLKAIEFQAGYYTRGYEWEHNLPKRRYIYGAIGLNVITLLRQMNVIKSELPALSYFQIPYTYLEKSDDLNNAN